MNGMIQLYNRGIGREYLDIVSEKQTPEQQQKQIISFVLPNVKRRIYIIKNRMLIERRNCAFFVFFWRIVSLIRKLIGVNEINKIVI